MQSVHTYFDPDPNLSGFNEVIKGWHERWADVGYEPVVLNEDDARMHPLFEQVHFHALSLPTINPKKYEMACWLRWLAADLVGGLHVDSDVLPIGKPKLPEFQETTMLEIKGVPCAVFVKCDGRIPKSILNHGPDRVTFIHEKPHCSDMTMFQQCKEFARLDLCREFGGEGWLEVSLCHLATEALRKFGFSKTKYTEPLAFFDTQVSQIEK